ATSSACSASPETPTAAPAAPTAAPAGQRPAAVASPVAARQPKRGGVMRYRISSNLGNLDPHLNVGTYFSWGPAEVYSRLLRPRPGAEVKPPSIIPTGDLAESWQQPDDTTYVFKLRHDARFQNIAPVNGRPVVADDVVYSLNRLRDL